MGLVKRNKNLTPPPAPADESEDVELEEESLEEESVEDIESEIKEEESEKPVPSRVMYLSKDEMLREILIGVQDNRILLEKVLELAKE